MEREKPGGAEQGECFSALSTLFFKPKWLLSKVVEDYDEKLEEASVK